ncbi:MAG: membrane protein insertase YidC [Candidatus Eisenbacteria bacterium]
MDRKALLAIVLSTVLIVGFQILFIKPQEPPLIGEEALLGEAAGPPVAAGVIASPADQMESEEAVPSIPPEEEEEGARIIPVSTPLFEMEIDTRGARISRIRLLDFEGTSDRAVELIGEEARAGLGLILETGDEKADLRGAVFQSGEKKVRLTHPAEASEVALEKQLSGGVTVRRTYRFRADSYRIDLEQTIASGAGAPKVFSYRLLWEPGIAFTEEDTEQEKREMAAVVSLAGKAVRDPARKVKEDEPIERTGDVRFAALKNKYFAIALIPEKDSGADVWIRRFPGEERVWLDVKMPVSGSGRDKAVFGLYAGPLDMDTLKREGVGLEAMIDLGWNLIRPIARLTLAVMKFFYKYVPNYGVVIILVSLLTKLLFYHLTHKSMKSMRDMQRIQGKVGELREKHKGDAQRLNKETMALYKREGVNPLSGCLPMLLQMPVFIALYQVLQRTIALRKAPFVFWIDDLSSPDVLANLPFTLPFLGAHLCLLPLLMGVSMIVQQKMTTVDPRQKAMIYMMPILFTGLFYRLPSGLVLYWLANNVFSIGQQYLMNRGEAKNAVRTEASPAGDEKKNDRNSKKATGRGRKKKSPTKETK